MKGAKAVNIISKILRITGIVLVLLALVLFLYAAISSGSRKTDLYDTALKNGCNLDVGFGDRLSFDDRYYSSMSAAASRNAELNIPVNGTPSTEQAEDLLSVVKPHYSDLFDRARARVTADQKQKGDDVYRWFENDLDPARFIAYNANIEQIAQQHEISEILETLQDLYQPPPKLARPGMTKPVQTDYFRGFWTDYRAARGNAAVGTWYEFINVVNALLREDLAGGQNITSEARAWYAGISGQDGFDERYDGLLAEFRQQEASESAGNFIVQLLELCQRKADGETVDFRGLLDSTYESLIARYPELTYEGDSTFTGKENFLLSIKHLTESLMGENDEEVPAEETAAEEAPAAEEAVAEEEIVGEEFVDEEISDEEIAAEDTAAEDEIDLEELAMDPNRFDGSLIKIKEEMDRRYEAFAATSPDMLERQYCELIVKDARDRSSIGMAVSYFWAFVAKYLVILAIGIALLIISAVMLKIMRRALLNVSADDGSMAAKSALENQSEGQDAPEQPEAFGDDVLLRVSHLKQYFRSGKFVNKAVDDISFYVKKGEVFGLVGESGCGKTTTGRTIINLYDPTEGDVYFEGLRVSSNLNGLPVLKRSLRNDARDAVKAARAACKEQIRNDPANAQQYKLELGQKAASIKATLREKLEKASTDALISYTVKSQADKRYRDRRIAELNEAYQADLSTMTDEAEKRARASRYAHDLRVAKRDTIMSKMQMIFQDPIASINPRMTVREIIAEGLVIQGVKDKAYINERVNEMLELVGLVREHADRYPHEFSGGQRQRIGIARAIIMNPDLIIADEPISALDVSIQAQVINLLNDLRDRMGLTIMFIAHNLSVVKYFSDRIAVMYYGRIVEMTTSDELFAHPLHPYTKSLLSAIPYPDPHYEKARQRIEYNPARAHDYSVDKPSLREITPGHYIYCNDPEFARYQKELGLQ